jgi:hypothetical protein
MSPEMIEELMQYARGGAGREMRERYGKPVPPEEGGEEMMPPEAGAAPPEPIPGVHQSEGGEPAGDEMDPEQLRQLLAALGG